jgi:hypothetical protein
MSVNLTESVWCQAEQHDECGGSNCTCKCHPDNRPAPKPEDRRMPHTVCTQSLDKLGKMAARDFYNLTPAEAAMHAPAQQKETNPLPPKENWVENFEKVYLPIYLEIDPNVGDDFKEQIKSFIREIEQQAEERHNKRMRELADDWTTISNHDVRQARAAVLKEAIEVIAKSGGLGSWTAEKSDAIQALKALAAIEQPKNPEENKPLKDKQTE